MVGGLCVVLFVCACDKTNPDGKPVSLKPVVQMRLGFDVAANSFRGTLAADAELTDELDEQANDPDGGDIVSYQWDFGDGVSSELRPTHTYHAVGRHEVVLTVTDDEGNTCDSQMTVVVSSNGQNDPPAVRIQANKLITFTSPDDAVGFQAITEDPEGDALTYLWDFGDGTSSSEQNVIHHYDVPGEYKPSVTVTDSSGNASSAHICLLVLPDVEGDNNNPQNDDEFEIECSPNPSSFVHGTNAEVSLNLVGISHGTPDSWSFVSGVPGAPKFGAGWDPDPLKNSFSIPSVEDGPSRVEYFPVNIVAANANFNSGPACDVFIFHFDGGGGGGGPPPEPPGAELLDGVRMKYAAPATVQTGDTLKMGVRLVDANGFPVRGQFEIGLGEPPGDLTAPHASGQLDEVGRANLETTPVFFPPGQAPLFGKFNGDVVTLTTILIE